MTGSRDNPRALEMLEKAARHDGKRPPIHHWSPEFSGDMDMRIARDGTWYHEGDPIRRPALVRLFSSILLREEDDYFLVTPVEKYRIRVDDAPFVAVEMESAGGGPERKLIFTTNLDDTVIAGPDHPLRVEYNEYGEPAPYILVRDNLEALIHRNVFYRLVDLGETLERQGRPWLAVTSAGEQFLLGPLEP